MTKRRFILHTKLQKPQIKGLILRRERLLNSLRDNLDKKLILICADAGYGKTTLLAQFCEELNKPYVFYDLDIKDNDVVTFFNYLINGIKKHNKYFGERIKNIILQTRDIEIIVGTFINEFIEKIKKDFYIVLDDYHHLQKSRKIADVIDYFLRHLPSNLHFVISSRSTPPLNLSYYLAKQELFNVNKEQLKFDLKEIHSLLKEAYKLGLHESEITRIAELSEGWITVIQLILQKICAAGADKVPETLNSYVASDEEVFDYFAREIFENKPKTIRQFLMKTSILEYLNPQICNFITHSRGSKKILSYLETAHMYVTKAGENFVYQPLFQDFLFKRLKSSFPNEVIRTLHSEASSYFLDEKDYARAVNHLLHAERYAKAAKVIEKNCSYWMKQGQLTTLIQMIDAFPDAVLTKYPVLLFKKSYALFEQCRHEPALKVLDSAIDLFKAKRDTDSIIDAFSLKIHIYFLLMQKRKALLFARKALQLIGHKNSSQKVRVLLRMADVYRVSGKFRKTKAILEEALGLTQTLKDDELELRVLRSLAMLHYSMSNMKESEKIYMEIFSRFQDQISEIELAYMYRSVASIAIDIGDTNKAIDYMARAERLAQPYNDHYLISYLTYLRGKLNLYEGEYESALEKFQEVLDLNKEIDVKYLDIIALADSVEAYLKIQNLSGAREALKKIEPLIIMAQDMPQWCFMCHMVRGKVETAEGNFDRGLNSLNVALKIIKNVNDPYFWTMIYNALSLHFLARENIGEALNYFKKCLVIAKKHFYDAFLIMEGSHDSRIFEIAFENNIMPDYVLSILDKIETKEAKDILSRMNIKRGVYDLECHFLGNLEIRDSRGRVIHPSWRTNKTKTLFIVLSMNHPDGYTRDQLIDTLWPKKGMFKGAHSLQVEISSLRKLLRGILNTGIPSKDLIIYKNQKYSLNPRFIIKADVHAFEDLIREASASEVGDRSKSIQLYNKALNLYEGDFCNDVMDDWCTNMRLYYKERIVYIYKKLGQFYYEDGDFAGASDVYQKALELDQYDESLYIGLMRCAAALKDRDNVQRYYQSLIKTLKKLKISQPSAEALEIYNDSLR